MVKPVFRRKSIGTKVSEEEYTRLEALAGGRALGEWVREVLLRELKGRQARPADEIVLAEALALRTILLNAFYKLAQGEKLTEEGMQAIIERADFRFSRRDVRVFVEWGDTQLKTHLRRLEELEYLVVHHGGRGQSFVYELAFEHQGDDRKPFFPGLIDAENLEIHDYDANRRGRMRRSRGQVGPKSGGWRGVGGMKNRQCWPSKTAIRA